MKKNVTINDVAKLANVSKATVSFYINKKFEKMSDETRKRIEKVIKETGYNPSLVARSLSNMKTKVLGVIIGDITNSFANQIVKGIMDYTKEEGYQIIVASSNYEFEEEKRHVQNMLAMGVDGFIVQPTINFEEWFKSEKKETPIVYFDSPSRDTKGMWVKTNNYEAVYEACERLVDSGYEDFVIVTADPHVLSTRLERNTGFTDCLKLKGKKYSLVLADEKTTPEILGKELQQYIQQSQNLCIFACNNWLLTKVYEVVKNHKDKVPQQLGLLGFDSLEWSEVATPTVTTIVQPAYDEGHTAASIMIDKLEERGNQPPQQILKCWINWCSSTKKD